MTRKFKKVLRNENIHVDDTKTIMMKTTAIIFVMMIVHSILFRFEKEVCVSFFSLLLLKLT